jgi:outer membrane protein assembly factor BamD
MKISGFRCFFVISICFISASCGQFRRIEKSEDWRVKYEAGLNYYNKKDYYHTAILFEQIQAIVRGLPEGEKVEFYLAYCQYYEKTYLLASNQFKTFYETYGRSPLRDEAQFMYAYSLFISSPDSNLDQKSSIEAMEAMQSFLNQHSESSFRDKAVEVITVCHKKLEFKGYENAKQYLKLRYYQAAVISFDNFKKKFPDSGFLEELAYLKVLAEYKLAQKSFPRKQLERYQATVEYYQELVDNFPNSSYLKEAQKLYSDSLTKINELKSSNINSNS